METFSALLDLCAGISPVTGVNSPHKGQWRGALMCFFYQWLNKRLSKQPRHRWFETPLCSLWRRCDVSGHGSEAVLLPGFAIDWSIAKSDNKTAALPWPDPLYVLVWRCECIVHGLFRATEFSGDIYALMNSLLHSKSTGVQFTVKPGIFTKS